MATALPPSQPANRLLAYLVFIGISLVFVISQALFFQGFNGVDDLHYSFLAHRMLQGNFSPFEINDLFAGRTLLVAVQAVVYAVGGVSIFITQAASYAAVVLAGYLTIFKLMPPASTRLVLIAATLFYFNPVLAGITLGPAPDVFILLAGVALLLLLKKAESIKSKTTILTGLLCGLLVFCTLLIKESGLVFLPFLVVAGFYLPKAKRFSFIGSVVISFIVAVALCGLIYYQHTGNFLFRVKQLQVAAYPNPCNYTSFFQKEMLVRLTYGVWEEFLSQNFLPVLLAVVAIVHGCFSKKERGIGWLDKRVFLILLLISLYFPFSVSNYQPLCFKARHFLFLLPLAVVVSSRWLDEAYIKPKAGWYRNTIAALLIGSSIKMSNNGWNWDFYRCLLALLILFPFLINKKMAAATPLLLAAVLWLSLPYRYIFYRTTWYDDLKSLNLKLPGNYFYFADHDNLMHWKLFHQFDTTVHYLNFDKKPFHIPNPYYEPLHFHPGWFIVNKQYTVRSSEFLNKIDSLQKTHFFEKTETKGVVSASYISKKQQFQYLEQIMDDEKRSDCNCGERRP